MDFVHCNLCFIQPEPGNPLIFWISSCGHINCSNCEDGTSLHCKLCSKPCKFVKLSKEMPQDMMLYFSTLHEETKKLIKILFFQLQNCRIYITEYIPHLENKYTALKNAFNDLKVKSDDLKQEMISVITSNQKLKEEAIELKREMSKFQSIRMDFSDKNTFNKFGGSTPGTPYGRTDVSSRSNRPTAIEALRKSRYNAMRSPSVCNVTPNSGAVRQQPFRGSSQFLPHSGQSPYAPSQYTTPTYYTPAETPVRGMPNSSWSSERKSSYINPSYM